MRIVAVMVAVMVAVTGCGGNVVVDSGCGGGGSSGGGGTSSSSGSSPPCEVEQGCNTSPTPPCGDAQSVLCDAGIWPPIGQCIEQGPACGRVRYCCQ